MWTTYFLIASVLFILYVAFLIGRRVASRVPDEVEPKYLSLGPDALLLLLAVLLFAGLDLTAVGIAVLLAMIAARAFLPFTQLYVPVSGAILGFAVLLETEQFATIILLCLVMNYLVGALADGKRLPLASLGQPAVACIALLAISLF